MSNIRKRTFSQVEPKEALKLVKELDAFPKVPDSYQEKSASGGGISILTFLLIAGLVFSEFQYYSATQLKFDYEVDTDYDAKMKVNIDMVVAMQCHMIGADILDSTNQNTHTFGHLTEEPTHFELSPNQRRVLKSLQDINKYLRDEYHAIHDLLWETGYDYFMNSMPPREDTPKGGYDACRLYGTLEINKVAGNFHITAGKSIPVIPSGHAHLSLMLEDKDYNFTHRINHFSFGDGVSGAISPLDGEELVTKSNYQVFQYFVQIVPTDVQTYKTKVNTYQFAVTEKNRTIDHSRGSHGVPGIFMKYDISPLKIRVREVHRPYWQFLVRLCGIVGGIFAVSGMLNSAIGYTFYLICCRYRKLQPVATTPPPIYSLIDNNPTTFQQIPLMSQNLDSAPT